MVGFVREIKKKLAAWPCTPFLSALTRIGVRERHTHQHSFAASDKARYLSGRRGVAFIDYVAPVPARCLVFSCTSHHDTALDEMTAYLRAQEDLPGDVRWMDEAALPVASQPSSGK